MLHYNFVYYYFLVLIYFVSADDAIETRSGSNNTISIELNSTMEEHCHEIKKNGFFEKKTCLEDFLGDKSTESGSNCTSIQSVERVFESVFNRTSDCYKPMVYQEHVNSSLQVRLDLLKQAMNKGKYFFDNGGSDCIEANKNAINECIFGNILGKNRTHIQNSEVRQGPLFISKQTCSRSTTIVKCIREALNQTCTNTISVEFIMSLNKPLEDRCDNITEVSSVSSATSKPNSGGSDHTTGNIIIGSLVGIIVVLIAAILIAAKLRKRSSTPVQQRQSYNISFQQNTESKTGRTHD